MNPYFLPFTLHRASYSTGFAIWDRISIMDNVVHNCKALHSDTSNFCQIPLLSSMYSQVLNTACLYARSNWCRTRSVGNSEPDFCAMPERHWPPLAFVLLAIVAAAVCEPCAPVIWNSRSSTQRVRRSHCARIQ